MWRNWRKAIAMCNKALGGKLISQQRGDIMGVQCPRWRDTLKQCAINSRYLARRHLEIDIAIF